MKLGQKDRKDIYIDYYRNLPKKIAAYYKLTYDIEILPSIILRISLDNLFKSRWRINISEPAIHNLNEKQFRIVVYNFKEIFDPKVMLEQICISNSYRVHSNESIISEEIINKLKIVISNKEHGHTTE